MRKSVVWGIVLAAHVVVVGIIFLLPGCGTTNGPAPAAVTAPEKPVVLPPLVQNPVPVKPLPPLGPVTPVEPVSPTGTKTYTVQSGDSLALIAKHYNVTVKDIVALNGLKNANKLRVGQKLQLPAYVDLNAAKPAVTHHKAVKPAGEAGGAAGAEGGYAVKAGDSLAKIAHAHHITVAALREANSLKSDKIMVGQKLAIPGAAAAAGGTPAGAVQPPAAPPVGAEAPAVGGATPPGPATPDHGATMIHVVGPNQDLSEIAMVYAVSTDEIMKLNAMSNATVKAGDRLKIPTATH